MFGLPKNGAQDDLILPFVEMHLQSAVDDGIDKIVFGEPCDDLPREKCTRLGGLEPFLSAEQIAAFNSTRDIPIWRRANGIWYEVPGVPWYLLHQIVRLVGDKIATQRGCVDLADSIGATLPLKTKHGEINVMVKLSIEPNYCYSVTLKKVD